MYNEDYIQVMENEIDWLQEVISQAIKSYFKQEGHENNWQEIPLPDLSEDENPYSTFIAQHEITFYGRLALALAITPHLRPEALDIFFGKNEIYDRGFTEFGGVTDKLHSGFLPTGQTLDFLIASSHPELKKEVWELFDETHPLTKEKVLNLGDTENHLPMLNGILSIDNGWLVYFMTGEKAEHKYSNNFPAKRINTAMNWEDVVLDEIILEQVNEVIGWLEYGDALLKDWDLGKKIKPGYRTLFYGPPGTGKTLTATLIGKMTEREVYRIDLSMVVSKYIGETEKNLSKLFDIAQNNNWILFFDEADALFGKRTAANSSNDRHANQQTAYLLQRIEDFPGVVILASNLKTNMDEAFTRRFQSMIHFTMPTVEERHQLWQKAFSGKCTLSPDIDSYQIAENYEMSGGSIINVLRFCALAAIKRNSNVVTERELIKGIRNELKKENKTMQTISI